MQRVSTVDVFMLDALQSFQWVLSLMVENFSYFGIILWKLRVLWYIWINYIYFWLFIGAKEKKTLVNDTRFSIWYFKLDAFQSFQ